MSSMEFGSCQKSFPPSPYIDADMRDRPNARVFASRVPDVAGKPDTQNHGATAVAQDSSHRPTHQQTFSQNPEKSKEIPLDYLYSSVHFNRGGANRIPHLSKLIQVADSRGLYLYITGLACYKKPNIPVVRHTGRRRPLGRASDVLETCCQHMCIKRLLL